jgi:hypothetical protein
MDAQNQPAQALKEEFARAITAAIKAAPEAQKPMMLGMAAGALAETLADLLHAQAGNLQDAGQLLRNHVMGITARWVLIESKKPGRKLDDMPIVETKQ